MKKYLLAILLLLLVPVSVNAQSILTEWFNIPAEWTRPPNLIYYVFIPFLGTFAIIWGVLTATRAPIFRNQRVNIIISLVFTVALFSSSVLPAIVLYLFRLGGFFGVLAFFFLFFVLTFLFGRRKVRAGYIRGLKSYDKVAKERRKEIHKIIDTDKAMDKLIKEHAYLEGELDKADNNLRVVKEWRSNDPRIRNNGFSSKERMLRHISDNIKKLEKALKENIEDQDRVRKRKKRMREK